MAVQKSTGRGERAVLLDVEEPEDSYRLETVDIPDQTLQETAETEETGRFLRTKERVSGRRRSRSRFTWTNGWVRVGAACIVIICLLGFAWAGWELKTVLLHNPGFMLVSTRGIGVSGNRVVSEQEVQNVFAPDRGHSIFRIPLERRQTTIEQMDWVRSATVMRFWPNRLRVHIIERIPIAFAREDDSIRLVDEDGAILELPNAAEQYSFPVITGLSASDPAAMRKNRMQQYQQLIHALDADGGHVSASVSEVDLSDPEDLRVVFTGASRSPVVHLGDKDFLARYRAYQTHLAEWLQQYPQLRSVDMRYGKQVVLDTGAQPTSGAEENAGGSKISKGSPNGPEQNTAAAAAQMVPTAPIHAPVPEKRAEAAHRSAHRIVPRKVARNKRGPGSHRVAKNHGRHKTPRAAPQHRHTRRNSAVHARSGT